MKNLKSILGVGILAGSLVLGGCGDKEKEGNKEALTFYIASEDSVFNDLVSQYKEDLSEKREYRIKLNETYDISKITQENNKRKIEELYKNELKILEISVKLRKNNKRILNWLEEK